MNRDFQCPYCDAWQEHDFEQGKPNELYQTECGECEKRFVFEVEYYPTFSAYKADCLNGAPHNYVDKLANDEYYRDYFSKWLKCTNCEHEIREAKKKTA